MPPSATPAAIQPHGGRGSCRIDIAGCGADVSTGHSLRGAVTGSARGRGLCRWWTRFGRRAIQRRDVLVKRFDQSGRLLEAWQIRRAGPRARAPAPLSVGGHEVSMETVVLTCEGIDPD